MNKQKYTNLNSVLKEYFIYNEVIRNGYNNILNIQANFKYNDVYKYIPENRTKFFCKYFILVYPYICFDKLLNVSYSYV